MDQEKIKERYRAKLQIWMHRLFRRTLVTVEQETKKFGIKEDFFNQKNKREGFGLIRKTVLDSGNQILEINDIFLDAINLEGKRETLEISPKVAEELK